MAVKEDVQWVDIGSITPYEKNPRDNAAAVPKVAESIKQFGFLSPIIVDANRVILAGHTRYLAAKSLGLEHVPIIVATNLSPAQAKAFRLADNKTAEYSKWNDALLLEQLSDLSAFQFDVADCGFEITEIEKRRMSWSRTALFCDLQQHIALSSHAGFFCTTLFKTGKHGVPIELIKQDPSKAAMIADNLCDYLEQTLGHNLRAGGWCIVTAPRRRHKDGFHFSSEVCRVASSILHITFYPDAFLAKNRARVHPSFELTTNPLEPNVLLFDDIITTGQTIRTCRQLLLDHGHCVVSLVGLKN
ncbi:MAG: ParB N-terminal domain-containing protein [Selenomonadaceae bacterium]|nr:ParB N-terminal domain-containing protein [Selenomonadaceae bacterium]